MPTGKENKMNEIQTLKTDLLEKTFEDTEAQYCGVSGHALVFGPSIWKEGVTPSPELYARELFKGLQPLVGSTTAAQAAFEQYVYAYSFSVGYEEAVESAVLFAMENWGEVIGHLPVFELGDQSYTPLLLEAYKALNRTNKAELLQIQFDQAAFGGNVSRYLAA